MNKSKLRSEETIPRVLADIVFINVSFLLASLVWFFIGIKIYVGILTDNLQFASILWHYYLDNFFYLTVIFLVSAYTFGFYTHTRSYRTRYKLLAILQSVTFSYLSFFFVTQFFFRADMMIRGVIALSWLFTLLIVGGARFLKSLVTDHFTIEPKRRSPKRKIEKVLIIGGAGYMGSLAVKLLLDRGYKVRVIDNLLYGSDRSIQEYYKYPEFEFVKGDLRDLVAVGTAIRDVDAVIHLGAIVGDSASAIDKKFTNQVNTLATMMIMKLCSMFQVNRLLFASTCSVYGASNEILNEKSYLNPLSLYAQSKLAGEKGILNNKNNGLRPTVLRFATLFGASPRIRNDLVVNLLAGAAVTRKEITLFGGQQWRPFIHVYDAARAIVSFLEAPLKLIEGEIFNVGSNDMNFQLMEIGEKIKQVIPAVKVKTNKEQNDPRDYHVSFDKIRQVLGFRCEKTIEDGIREIKTDIEKGLIKNFWDDNNYNYKYLKGILPKRGSQEYFVYLILEDLLNKENTAITTGTSTKAEQ